MSELIAVYGVSAVLLGGLGLLAISGPRHLVLKLGALATTAALLPTAYVGFVSLMSLPKPTGFEWWHARAEEAEVLASQVREGQGIYLWLQLPAAQRPRAYALPWDRDLAEQLQTAARAAADRGGRVQMRSPFEASLDDRTPKFYAPPPSAPPLKSPPADPALEVSRADARP